MGVTRKFWADDGGYTTGGRLYTKIFIMHFYAQNAVPGLRGQKRTIAFLQPKMGLYTSGVIHQALQYLFPKVCKCLWTLYTLHYRPMWTGMVLFTWFLRRYLERFGRNSFSQFVDSSQDEEIIWFRIQVFQLEGLYLAAFHSRSIPRLQIHSRIFGVIDDITLWIK